MNKIDKIMKKAEKYEVTCIPARIRKCNGFVIESYSGKNRKNTIDVVKGFIDSTEYNAYPLFHRENDWTYPAFVSEYNWMANKYGWFITKDTMEFRKYGYNIQPGKDIVTLNRTNSHYLDVTVKEHGIDIIHRPHIFNAKEIYLVDYLKIEKKLCEMIDESFNKFSNIGKDR